MAVICFIRANDLTDSGRDNPQSKQFESYYLFIFCIYILEADAQSNLMEWNVIQMFNAETKVNPILKAF